MLHQQSRFSIWLRSTKVDRSFSLGAGRLLVVLGVFIHVLFTGQQVRVPPAEAAVNRVIEGIAFEDKNANDQYDGGDSPIADSYRDWFDGWVQVDLWKLNATTNQYEKLKSDNADRNGRYRFASLAAGTYTLTTTGGARSSGPKFINWRVSQNILEDPLEYFKFGLGSGFFSQKFTLGSGATTQTYNIPYFGLTTNWITRNLVYDANADNTYEPALGDVMMSGVPVDLFRKTGTTYTRVASTTSNVHGTFFFQDLGAGEYYAAPVLTAEQKTKWVPDGRSIDGAINFTGVTGGSGGGYYYIRPKDTEDISEVNRVINPSIVDERQGEIEVTVTYRLAAAADDDNKYNTVTIKDYLGKTDGSNRYLGVKYARQAGPINLRFTPNGTAENLTLPLTTQPAEDAIEWISQVQINSDDLGLLNKIKKGGLFTMRYRVAYEMSSTETERFIGYHVPTTGCEGNGGGSSVNTILTVGEPWEVAGYERSFKIGPSLGYRVICRAIPNPVLRLAPPPPSLKFCLVDQDDSTIKLGGVDLNIDQSFVLERAPNGDFNNDYPKITTGGGPNGDGCTNPGFINYAALEALKTAGDVTHTVSASLFGYRDLATNWTYLSQAGQIVGLTMDKLPEPRSLKFKVIRSDNDNPILGAKVILNRTGTILGNPPNVDSPYLVTGPDGLTNPTHLNYDALRGLMTVDITATATRAGALDGSANFRYQDMDGQVVTIRLNAPTLTFCARSAVEKRSGRETAIAGARFTFTQSTPWVHSNPPNPVAPYLDTAANGCTTSSYVNYASLESLLGQGQTSVVKKTNSYADTTFNWTYQKTANQTVVVYMENPPPIPTANLGVSKVFPGSSDPLAMTIRQGQVGSYRLTVNNTGQAAASNILLRDIQDDTHNAGQAHSIAWVPASITDAVQSTTNSHQIDWQVNTPLAPGQTITKNPSFIVRCNAPVTTSSTPLRNLALVTTSTPESDTTNNTNNSNIRLFIAPGDVRIALAMTASRSVVSSGNSFNLNLQLSNSSTTDDVRYLTLSTILPSQFTPVANSASSGGTITGQQVTWMIDPLTSGAPVTRTVAVSVNQGVAAQVVTIPSSAVSLAADPAGTCGTASASTSVRIEGPLSTISKKASVADVEKGEEFTYYVRLNNRGTSDMQSTVTLSDPLDPRLDFVRQDSCKVIEVTKEDDVTGSPCGTDQSPNPTISGQTLRWSISRVMANTAVVYPVVVKVKSSVVPDNCPDPINNILTLDQGGVTTSVSSGVNFYAAQCLEGNLYARNANERGGVSEGIKITGSDVIIAPQSVLASTQTIVCSSPKCSNVPWKIANYEEASSVGLNFTDVQKRMERNSLRVAGAQTVLPSAGLSGGFNFYTGTNEASYAAKAQFPEGRVWYTPGDLTINTGTNGREFVFTGKGTLLVGGNLIITGGGKLKYTSESFLTPGSSAVDAAGFIVENGNVSVGADVRQIVGAYYAPKGAINFEGPGTRQLRPANGIFIGGSINVARDKVVFRYNNRLTSAVGAPPGFSFASSPGK